MNLGLELEPWWRFAAALLIGALIGLEREYIQQRSGYLEFAGIRTFALMALFGAAAAFISIQFGILAFVVAYLGLVLLIGFSFLGEALRGQEEGITTEVVGLIVPLLGALVIWDYAELALSLGVITALLLASKNILHDLARRIDSADLRAILEFALISAVILPILPNRDLGPFGVINPYKIWLLVVLVFGISFLGYILINVLGAKRGTGLTGLLGGLVSSTAVTLTFAGRSKESPGFSAIFAIAILLASCVMFPRVLVEVLVVNPALVRMVIIPLASMLVAGLLGFIFLWRRNPDRPAGEEGTVTLANPLKLRSAIGFALLFALILLIVEVANVYFGDTGVYIASLFSGLMDVDAITLSTSDLAAKGQIETRVAAIAILIAVLVNTALKAVVASILGTSALRRIILSAFGFMLVVGLLTSAATLTYFLM